LFLHSSPHNWVRKCLGFLPFIGELPYIYFTVGKALWMSVIYLYFIFTIFLLTEQMWQPSKDISLKIKGKM